jgi:hypothetical protein
VSPYLVVSNGGNLTKHIYMGSQRIIGNVSYSANKDSILYGYEYNRLTTISYPRHPESNIVSKNAWENRPFNTNGWSGAVLSRLTE